MLRHAHISLRHVTEADLPLLEKVRSDPEMRGEFTASRMINPQEVRKRFEKDAFSSDDHELLMICDEAGVAVGNVVHFVARRYSTAREIGWIIFDKGKQGQGYGTAAALALIDYLFKSFPINRIECSAYGKNHASIRVAEKCGFVKEGTSRGVIFIAGNYLDSETFSILRTEWEKRQDSAPS